MEVRGMGIVDKVKKLTGGGGPRTYDYECEQCESTFVAEARNPNDVSCPDCGSARVYSPL